MRARLLTPDQAARAVELRTQGCSLREIGALLGVSKDTVARSLRLASSAGRTKLANGAPTERPIEAEPRPDAGWPPPATPDSRWFTLVVQNQPMRLRQVLLWGHQVLIDDAGNVLCTGCWRIVDVKELAVDQFGRPRTEDGFPVLGHRPRHRLEMPR